MQFINYVNGTEKMKDTDTRKRSIIFHINNPNADVSVTVTREQPAAILAET